MNIFTYDKIIKVIYQLRDKKQLTLSSTYDKEIKYELNKQQSYQKEKIETMKETIDRLIEENDKLHNQIKELTNEKIQLEQQKNDISRKIVTTNKSLENFK
jgi:chromosome segregation ATPase